MGESAHAASSAREAKPGGREKPKVFDTLDFDVFGNQKWNRLNESHASDIVVTWPDGHETQGIEKHIEDLKALFVFAPDIKIKTHLIRFGSGTWTAVTGVMTGTFSKPMPTLDGKSIAPTGKRFALGMVTVGHWKGGTMDHEWLIWDNQDFMNHRARKVRTARTLALPWGGTPAISTSHGIFNFDSTKQPVVSGSNGSRKLTLCLAADLATLQGKLASSALREALCQECVELRLGVP